MVSQPSGEENKVGGSVVVDGVGAYEPPVNNNENSAISFWSSSNSDSDDLNNEAANVNNDGAADSGTRK